MKKIITLSVFFLALSCGVQKKVAVDPMLGQFSLTIFQVPGYGDIPLTLQMTKAADGSYAATFVDATGATDSTMDIASTAVTENKISIEANAQGYDVYMDLTLTGDDITGSLMDMFEVKGIRVQK